MSGLGKQALESIGKVLPELSEFQQGRIYGIAERIEEEKRQKGAEDDNRSDNLLPAGTEG